jgi:hypothetical protein
VCVRRRGGQHGGGERETSHERPPYNER